MTAVDLPGTAACPACATAPLAGELSRRTGGEAIYLSLPTIHCAACISTVENGLLALPGVHDARVNLTRKRATIRAEGLTASDLAAAVSALGYEAQPLDAATLSAGASDAAARDLSMRLGVAGFAMMNVMLLSVAVWSGAADATRDLFHWISAAIALPAIAFAAQPFFRNALAALRALRLNMDVPISLAILLAAAMSVAETARHGGQVYFDAALSLTFFLLAGRWLDQRMRSTARSAATELAALEVPTALRLEAGGPVTVPASALGVGDRLLVRPGARVAVDGVIEEGESELDRAFLTGETEPAAAGPGDALRAGELNLTGPLTVRATAVGRDTTLHALADLVAAAETGRSRYTSLADRAARIYAPAVHLLALAAFAFWLAQGLELRLALNIAVAVLIITCPCALGLAVPAVSTVASGRLFRAGLLVKDATALERLAEVDAVILDKTGTLTTGEPVLSEAAALAPLDLALAAALAEGSDHPRSRAIAAAARGRDLPEVTVTDRREWPGQGVSALWNGRKVRLGRGAWAGDGDGTCLAVEGEAPVALGFDEQLRPGAAELVAALGARGLPVTLLSGDAEPVVARLAGSLGIADWQAGLMPEDKIAVLQARADAGQRILMVGDGLNDVGALALAHVSIAPASALEATRVAADMVLVGSDLARLGDAMRIATRARRRIMENFGLAAAYNLIAVPVAFLGFATPLAAAIAMSTSSILVSLNALRVR